MGLILPRGVVFVCVCVCVLGGAAAVSTSENLSAPVQHAVFCD